MRILVGFRAKPYPAALRGTVTYVTLEAQEDFCRIKHDCPPLKVARDVLIPQSIAESDLKPGRLVAPFPD